MLYFLKIFNTFYYNYTIDNWICMAVLEISGPGLELGLLSLQDATWPPLVIGACPPQLTCPRQGGGGHNAFTYFIPPGVFHLSVPCHPTVLASQVAYIYYRTMSKVSRLNFAFFSYNNFPPVYYIQPSLLMNKQENNYLPPIVPSQIINLRE